MSENQYAEKRPLKGPYEIWFNGYHVFHVLAKLGDGADPRETWLVAVETPDDIDEQGLEGYAEDIKQDATRVWHEGDGKIPEQWQFGKHWEG